MIPTWLLSLNFASLVPVLLLGGIARGIRGGMKVSGLLWTLWLLLLVAVVVGISFDDPNGSNYQYQLSGRDRYFIEFVCEQEKIEPCSWEAVRTSKIYDEVVQRHFQARDYRLSFALLINGTTLLIFFALLVWQTKREHSE